jgi:glycosyltransferase involved in cell wall biosynthesis
MRIALVAPPFIPVPPRKYGGTELFIADLALGLSKEGIDVTVYTNGESTINCPTRWLYDTSEWPMVGEVEASLKGLNHAAWAIKEASVASDIIHINNAPALSVSRFVDAPLVFTLHHAYDAALHEFYEFFPHVSYVTISRFQQNNLRVPRVRAIHHGIDLSRYRLVKRKQPYLAFLGRVAPPKGTHVAIEIAKKAGIPLKIAGEIQPCYEEYWKRKIKPEVDGKFIEYVGEVGLEEKNQLLGNAMAMLFPIQWDEPFGLVMIESMACGTPVLALPGGSVNEVVLEGVSGHVRSTSEELASRARNLVLAPEEVRAYVQENFSAERMARDYIQLYEELIQEQANSHLEGLAA